MKTALEFLESLNVPILVRTTLLSKPELLAWLQEEMERPPMPPGYEWECFRMLLDGFTVCAVDRQGNTPPFEPLPPDFIPTWLELQVDTFTVLFAVHGTIILNRMDGIQVPVGLSQAMQRNSKPASELATIIPLRG